MQGLPGLGQSPSLLLLTPKQKSVARGLALSCSSPHSSTAFLCSSPKGRSAQCSLPSARCYRSWQVGGDGGACVCLGSGRGGHYKGQAPVPSPQLKPQGQGRAAPSRRTLVIETILGLRSVLIGSLLKGGDPPRPVPISHPPGRGLL